MSIINLIDIGENFKSKEVSFHIDTFGREFCVYGYLNLMNLVLIR